MSQIRFLDRLKNAIRVRQYSMATEKAYLGWARRYILFHHKRLPAKVGKCEVGAVQSTNLIDCLKLSDQ